MKKLTEQQKIRRQILFNMPYLLLTFLIKEKDIIFGKNSTISIKVYGK